MIEYRMKWHPSQGIGSNIILLSTLLDAGPTRLMVNRCNRTIITELKRIFNIDDSRLILEDDPEDWPDEQQRLCDDAKFFSPYLMPDTVNLFGRMISTANKKSKPCIGIAYLNNGDNLDLISSKPIAENNRYYSKEQWLKIISLVMSAGYDVITINSNNVDIEKKVFLLNELCEAVISYEGGVAHLAHCLDIPSIILAWPRYPNGLPTDASLVYKTHKLHIDQKTWIFNDAEELIEYTPVQLREKIEQLHQRQGNNIYLSDRVLFDVEKLTVISKDNPLLNLSPWFTRFEKEFIKTYII